MNSSEETIRELELKRQALNERLMNAKDLAEANSIERELWALRAAIRYHKNRFSRGPHEPVADRSLSIDVDNP